MLKTLGRLFKYMISKHKLTSFLVLLGVLGSAIATLIMTLFIQSLVDDYISPLLAAISPDYSDLFLAILKLIGVLICGVGCAYLYNRLMVTICQQTLKQLRIDMFTKMEWLPVRFFDTTSHGCIMSIYTNDVDTLRQFLSQSLPQLLNSCFSVISTFISMVVLAPKLALTSAVVCAVMIIISLSLSKISGKYFTAQQKDLGELNGYIEEMTEGQRVVKAFCHEAESVDGFVRLNEKLQKSAFKANAFSNIIMPINGNLGNVSYVLCAVIGSTLMLGGEITAGTLIAFLSLNKNFTQPVTQISQQVNSIAMAAAGAERIFKFLDEENAVDNGTVVYQNGSWASRGEEHEQRGDIVFEHVNFAYDTKPILKDINMYAQAGQKVALVGSTGAGKTTITNLINRFYEISDGSITYDGIPIKEIKKTALRQSMGVVLQEASLFSGTIMDNIRYGNLEATDEECINAAKMVHADDFIQKLHYKYDTNIAKLSQGQQQLITIARVAVKNPALLILDEATSSIDTKTEKMVQTGMDALMEGRTTFVIAHRLSTIKDADCIMVLEQGEIVERGTHESLLAKHGRYWELCNAS